jgi:outer membrane protein assembly factor BamB
MPCRSLRFLSTVLALLVCALPRAAAENWPQWRGPSGDGISRETNLPAAWGADKNLAWKLPLPGMAGSTPVVWGDRIFLTSEDESALELLCVSTEGKLLWKHKLAAGQRRYRRDEGNNASPSPATDGDRVFTYFGTGDCVCVDMAGKEVWRFNVQDRYGSFKIQHGMHVTPVLHGDRLYFALLHSGGHWVIALDKATGREVWKVDRASDARFECEQAYASPFIWQNGKDAYLVVHGNDYTTAHRLTDGREIWRLGGLNPKSRYHTTLRFVASPAVTPNLIVVPTAKNGPVVGVRPDATGMVEPGSPSELWRRPNNTPDVPSPLVYGDLVYLCRENGVLLCLEAQSGKELYQERLQVDRYRASPVYADGKIYCAARQGTVSVVKAGPQFELLAVNRLPDEFAASPVISGGRIYLRGFQALYAISHDGK